MIRALVVSAFLLLPSSFAGADWPAWHGGPQRTGAASADAVGPKTPQPAWVFQPAGEPFIGSAALVGDKVIVPGVGTLGGGSVRCLNAADGKLVWKAPNPKAAGPDTGPLLSIVSAPAAVGGRLVLGEGMHQHEKTALRCLSLADGSLLWAMPIDSHLEGGPSIVGGRVYSGAGGQGVVCLEMDTVVIPRKAVEAEKDLKPAKEFADLLDKELPAERAAAAWLKEQQRQVEEAKKDCLPPVDVPRPRPKVVWQTGAGKLHVDSAVTVADGAVFAGSAFIDNENVGERCVLALSAADGSVLWKKPVAFNPWGSPSYADGRVLVGCSSIRFDPKEVAGAKGEVIAFDAKTGAEVWKKPLPGGVLSAVARVGGTGYVSCTDGKVYALDAATGNTVWTYDAKAAIFCTPAVADGWVYVADLKGVVHAVDAETGAGKWTLDLAGITPKADGPVYSSPVVGGGRLVITVGGEKGSVVCIGGR